MKDIYLEEKYQQYRKFAVGTRFSQVYEEAVDVIFSITSATALKLLFWVLNKMDDDNIVVIRKSEKLGFIQSCMIKGGERFSISTINKAIKVLVDKGFIVSTNQKGQRMGGYFVNPAYFWKSNSQKDRNNRIKEFHAFLKFKANEKN